MKFYKGQTLLYVRPHLKRGLVQAPQIVIFDSTKDGRAVVLARNGTEFKIRKHINFEYLKAVE